MGKGRPQKYNRISCQQKFILRKLIIKEKMSVKHAAQALGINYSTAKTIMFFYRKTSCDQNSISSSIQVTSKPGKTAGYIEMPPAKKIQILYSCDGSEWAKHYQVIHYQTEDHQINKRTSI